MGNNDLFKVIPGGRDQKRFAPKNIEDLKNLIEKCRADEKLLLSEEETDYIKKVLAEVEDKLWNNPSWAIDEKISCSRNKDRKKIESELKLKQAEIRSLIRNRDVEGAKKCGGEIIRLEERLKFMKESLRVADEQAESNFRKILDEMKISEELYWELRVILGFD